MFKLKILSADVTKKVLNMEEVIEGVASVYKQKAEDNTVVFPLVFHEFNPGHADMDIKSGWLKGSGIFGLKMVSWFDNNPKKGLPALVGTILVADAATGAPKGILDGSFITGIRTGAAGAIGAKALAREDSKTLMIVGAGHIAAFQVAATLTLMPQIEKVYIYDAIDVSNAEKFADEIGGRLKNEFGIEAGNRVFSSVENPETAVGESDIIITVTPSKKPIIKKEWVKPGTHFSCIGADMAGKEEIEPEIFEGARVFADDIPQCINVGELEIPVKKGNISAEDIAGEIGEVLLGNTEGRQNAEQITIFDATGTALLDLITAELAMKSAEKQGLGQIVEL